MTNSKKESNIFREKALNKAIERVEALNKDGTDKSWVPKLMLVWNRHYMRKLLNSKKIAGREKDRLFLKRYQALLKEKL